MGDMAEWALEQVLDEWGNPDADDEEGPFYDATPARRNLSCRYCGCERMVWLRTKNGWRTSADGKTVHQCPAFQKSSK